VAFLKAKLTQKFKMLPLFSLLFQSHIISADTKNVNVVMHVNQAAFYWSMWQIYMTRLKQLWNQDEENFHRHMKLQTAWIPTEMTLCHCQKNLNLNLELDNAVVIYSYI